MKWLVAILALGLPACTLKHSMSSGEASCEYQRERSFNAEQIATIVRPIFTATGADILSAPAVKMVPLDDTQECQGRLCMSLVGDTCTVIVNQ